MACSIILECLTLQTLTDRRIFLFAVQMKLEICPLTYCAVNVRVYAFIKLASNQSRTLIVTVYFNQRD